MTTLGRWWRVVLLQDFHETSCAICINSNQQELLRCSDVPDVPPSGAGMTGTGHTSIHTSERLHSHHFPLQVWQKWFWNQNSDKTEKNDRGSCSDKTGKSDHGSYSHGWRPSTNWEHLLFQSGRLHYQDVTFWRVLYWQPHFPRGQEGHLREKRQLSCLQVFGLLSDDGLCPGKVLRLFL